MFVSYLDEVTQKKLADLLYEEIKGMHSYEESVIKEYVQDGLNGKVTDLSDVITPEMEELLEEGYFKKIEDGLIQYELDEFIDPSGDNDLEFVNNEIKKIPKLEKDSVVYLYHTELGDHHSFDFQATLYMESLELHKEASNEFFSVEEVIKYDNLYELANDVENYNSSDLSYFNEHDIDELEGVYLELLDMEEKGISFEADSYLKEFQDRKLNRSISKDNGMEM